MNLTVHQKEVMFLIIEALAVHNRVVLQGSAGVGKTFLVNELLNNIRISQGNLVYLTAPTNKALAVLRSKTEEKFYFEFATVHSALRLKRRYNGKTGDVFFKQEYSSNFPPFKKAALIIIDEASMLNNEILKYLKEIDVPILFIGDEKQLNPVGEDESPVFHQNWKTLELTEIIRQGEGNPIIDLSRDIKQIWKGKEKLNQEAGYLYTTKRNKIIDKLSEANGTDELKYLSWTNQEVDTMNYSVRHNIYTNPGMLEQGETLIFNAPYGDNFYTNQEVKAELLTTTNQVFDIQEGLKISFKLYKVNDVIQVVHEDSIQEYKKVVKSLKQRCKNEEISWKYYFEFIEQFADFKYNHAITVHKSQGSTYGDVILNVGDINRNFKKKEKQRLFYTGITRASNLLILYNV